MAPEYEQAVLERGFRFINGVDPIAGQLEIEPGHFAVTQINPNKPGNALEGTAFAVEGPGKQPLFKIGRDPEFKGFFAIYPLERTELYNGALRTKPRERILVSFSDGTDPLGSTAVSNEVDVFCRFAEPESPSNIGFAQVKKWNEKDGKYEDVRLCFGQNGWEGSLPGVTFVGVGDVLYVVPMKEEEPVEGCIELDETAAEQLAKIIKNERAK